MTRRLPSAVFATGAFALLAPSSYAQLINDTFDTDTSANYMVIDDGTPDGMAQFAYDYGLDGIPSAPRSGGSTLGLRLDANLTLGATDSVTCFHTTAIAADRYRLTVDVYSEFNTAGTTEYPHIGVGGDGVTPNSVFTPISGTGSFFAFTGDGGSGSSDYRWFRDAANSPAGDPASTTLPNDHPSYLGHGSRNTDPFFDALFPSPPSTFPGSPSQIWVTVEAEVDNTKGVVTYSMNGAVVYRGQFSGRFDGLASLGLHDAFTSVSDGSFTIFDNLSVVALADQPAVACTQSTRNDVVVASQVACAAMTGDTTPQQFLRRYVPGVDCCDGTSGDYTITGAKFGIEVAAGLAPGDVAVRAYSIPSGMPIVYANMMLLAETFPTIPDQTQAHATANFAGPVVVTAGNDLVLELAQVAAQAPGLVFRAGGNNLGQSGLSYIAAAACGVPEPTDVALLGFANAHLLLDPINAEIGLPVCSPNLPNSTGVAASIIARGSTVAANNDVNLTVCHLPMNSMGYFITSQELNILPVAGSEGAICIASFTIGRYNSMVLDSGSEGLVSMALDLTNTPVQPGGSTSVMAGETRFWQLWYRDMDAAGGATSNFSDAVCVDFN